MRKPKLIITLTAAILCVFLAFSAMSTSAATRYGDVDADGEVAILDAALIQRHLAQIIVLTDEQIEVAQVRGEPLSVVDASLIQKKIAMMIDKFPVEEESDVTTPTIPEEETLTRVNEEITIHFSNNTTWSKVYAYIYDYESGSPHTAWPGILMTDSTTNDYGETVYSLTVDTAKYDRIIFTNGAGQTTDTPLTVANSGYFVMTKTNNKAIVGVYPYGQSGEGTIKQVNLEYSKGYSKRITIWTPVGYDPEDTSKKYSVLYMTDGQNIFGNDENCSSFEWEVDETVLSYMQNGGDGIIVVGIDNANSYRDSELTPDIGDVVPKYNSGGFKNGTGQAYSEFVVNTVIPYIDSNYNTNSVRGIAGSSSGGIESFYIGMENMDKFDYIGAISPAFLLYNEATWKSYLSKFDFESSDLPRIYFFNGNSKNDSLEQELYPNAVAMQGWLESLGYPSELLKTRVDNDATHNEKFWAVYFPEALAFGLGY